MPGVAAQGSRCVFSLPRRAAPVLIDAKGAGCETARLLSVVKKAIRGRSPERPDASGGGSRPIWGTLTQFLPGLLSELNSGENSIKDHAARPGAAHGSAARPLGGPHDRSARLRHVLSSAPKVTFHCALRGAPTPRADLRGAAHDGRPPPAAREAKPLLANHARSPRLPRRFKRSIPASKRA